MQLFIDNRRTGQFTSVNGRVPIRAYGIRRGSMLSVEKVEKAKKKIEAVQKENKAPENTLNKKFLTAFSK